MLEIDDAFYAKFNADNAAGVGVSSLAGGRVVRAASVPQGFGYPRATYLEVSNVPIYTLPELNHRRVRYQLEGVELGTSAQVAGKIAQRITALVMDGTLEIAGWTLVKMRETFAIPPFAERDGDQVYQHVGLEVEMIIAPA